MEITIYDKVYKSGKTTMGTLRKVTELAKLVEERERISLGEDEEAQLKLIESIDPLTDIDKNVGAYFVSISIINLPWKIL